MNVAPRLLPALALTLCSLPMLASADSTQEKDMSRVEIMSHWSVQLPFTPAAGAPKNVGFVANDGGMAPGDQIVAINGMRVPHINAIPAMLRLSTTPGDMTYVSVDLEYRTSKGAPKRQMKMQLPITQDTVLANGMRFETMYTGQRWNTTLVDVPQGVDTDLQIGDLVIGHGDGTAFNTRLGFRDRMRSERRAEKSAFSVVVVRDKKLMLCRFAY